MSLAVYSPSFYKDVWLTCSSPPSPKLSLFLFVLLISCTDSKLPTTTSLSKGCCRF